MPPRIRKLALAIHLTVSVGWLGAVQRGFHEGRPSDDHTKHWLTHVEADSVVCTGAWLPEGEFGAEDVSAHRAGRHLDHNPEHAGPGGGDAGVGLPG